MKRSARTILWLDSGAAWSAGVSMLLGHAWLARHYKIAPEALLAMGLVNVLYGSYSGWLAWHASYRQAPSRRAVGLLVFANLTWAAVCATLFVTFLRERGSVFLLGHLAFEGLFVGALGLIERRWVGPFAR